MPTPVPATDAQLRQLAERGAQRWADNVLGDFDRHWRIEQATDTVLSAVPAEQRDAMTDQFAQFLGRAHDRLITVVDRYRGPIADQAWAVLAARNPGPSDRDLGHRDRNPGEHTLSVREPVATSTRVVQLNHPASVRVLDEDSELWPGECDRPRLAVTDDG